jgi:hypothetical protein
LHDLICCHALLFRRNDHGLQNGFIITVAMAFLAAPSARAQGAAGEPTGIWLTQAGDARVRVSKCGGGICGVIAGLKEPVDPATGKPQVETESESACVRPMIGLPLFSSMQPTPRQMVGADLQCRRRLQLCEQRLGDRADTLKVEGCVGALCGGENWTRRAVGGRANGDKLRPQRGLDPRILALETIFRSAMDCRVKPGKFSGYAAIASLR